MRLQWGDYETSKETLWPLERCWRNVEHGWYSPLSPQLETGTQEENKLSKWPAVWMVLCSGVWVLSHLQETGHGDVGWDTVDQVYHEYSGQQAGWTDQQSFKLDVMGERDVFLSDWKETGNTDTLGCIRQKPQNCSKGIKEGTSRKVIRLTAQLKCLYSNACRKGAK